MTCRVHGVGHPADRYRQDAHLAAELRTGSAEFVRIWDDNPGGQVFSQARPVTVAGQSVIDVDPRRLDAEGREAKAATENGRGFGRHPRGPPSFQCEDAGAFEREVDLGEIARASNAESGESLEPAQPIADRVAVQVQLLGCG
jgi:hypothetical protein